MTGEKTPNFLFKQVEDYLSLFRENRELGPLETHSLLKTKTLHPHSPRSPFSCVYVSSLLASVCFS